MYDVIAHMVIYAAVEFRGHLTQSTITHGQKYQRLDHCEQPDHSDQPVTPDWSNGPSGLGHQLE